MDPARSMVNRRSRSPKAVEATEPEFDEDLRPLKFVRFTEAVKEIGQSHMTKEDERLFYNPTKHEIVIFKLGVPIDGIRKAVWVRHFSIEGVVCHYELEDDPLMELTFRALPRKPAVA